MMTRASRLFVTVWLLFATAAIAHAAATPRNLFTELLGKSETEISAKIDAGFRQLFHGNNETERVYYPVANDEAYIADIGNQDVRSEGMSYGMMIAVQLDRREEFDRIWKWARTHMYHETDPRRGYFAWQCTFDGKHIDPGSASDGEAWIATALLFAAHRWGSRDGIFDYAAEAQALLREMLHKPAVGNITPIFSRAEKQIVFAPTREASRFTDPSYHVPAFFELWSQWSTDEGDRSFWKKVTRTSRKYLHKAAHPKTGLMPEYSYFDGRPFTETTFGAGKGDFRFDAWRTLANVALDHAWFSADPWQVKQSNRVLRFLSAQGDNCPNQFTLAGEPLSKDPSEGLFAMAAVAGLAAEPGLARPFVQRLWDADVPSGRWRYYNGLLYQLALLQVSGRFRIIAPN
jgi:oligosaccharide reducing-end xylanase